RDRNVTGVQTCALPIFLEACRHENRGARVVYAGTRQSYGRPESLPLVETQILKPVDVNGVSKMAGEWFHMVYDRAHGLSAVSLRSEERRVGKECWAGYW